MKLYLLVAFLGFLCIQFVVTKDDCEMAKSCKKCTKMMNCAWCEKAENISSKMVRCRSVSEDLSGWKQDCGQQFTSESGSFMVMENMPLSFSHGFPFERFEHDHPVLISPQKISMELKAVRPQNVTMNIRIAQDDPVDIYLLMDFSSSTDEYKAFLSTLAHKLAEKIPRITSNFRIGFGSIIPCDICEFSSGFQNFLSLSRNIQTFLEGIDKFIRDAIAVLPSDKLDVILQAINCDREIAWRKTAKHFLIFTSNAASIKNGPGPEEFVISNRSNASESCDLNAEGFFARNGNHPFIHEVLKASQREKIQIFFVAPVEKLSSYHELSNFIRGSIPTLMTPDARIVLRTLRKNLERVGKIELRDSAQKPVSLRYFSRCGKRVERETSLCRKVRLTEEIQFTIEVAVAGCPTGQFLQRQTFEVFGVGISDRLSLDIQKIIFGCECDQAGKEVDVTDPNWRALEEEKCKSSSNSEICSGLGTCLQGMCNCNERNDASEVISGRFCECTNYMCDHFDGKLCSGPDHGVCVCNKCSCAPGWAGDACECSTNTDNCIAPGTGDICSLNGVCDCNSCRCSERFKGKYCNRCPTCANDCVLFRRCAECQLFAEEDVSSEDCDELCRSLSIRSILRDLNLKVNESMLERLCIFYHANFCQVKFVVGRMGFESPYIRLPTTSACPPEVVVNKARACHHHGHLRNGICECMTGYYGRRCEFGDSTEPNSMALDDERCKASADSAICSGLGTCVDGMCRCNERTNPNEFISGRFCECTNFVCEYLNGEICSGPDHGMCRCNKCICKPGWMGEVCDCSTQTDNCVAPGTQKICSLHGSCDCNICRCSTPYTGEYCEDCPTCSNGCQLFRPCVECNLVDGNCDEHCASLGIHSIIRESILKVNDSEEERLCSFLDSDDCFVKFAFRSNNFEPPYIRVQTALECPPPQKAFDLFLNVVYTLLNLL